MGRRLGDKNASTKRAETAARVRAWREKQRDKAEAEMEAAENSERLFRNLRSRGFTLFGELEAAGPDGLPVNATTADEELMLAKEYCTALGIPAELRSGQTIRNFVIETLRAWVTAGSKFYNRETRMFATVELEGVKPDEYTVAGEDQTEKQP